MTFDIAGDFENIDTATSLSERFGHLIPTQTRRGTLDDVTPLPRFTVIEVKSSSRANRQAEWALAALEAFERQLFDSLVSEWFDDTKWHSSISSIVKHPAFTKIVGLNRAGARFILERMAEGDVHVHWFPALKDITGADPVPDYERGRVSQMTRRWLEWGKAEGLLRGNA
jgi:hypothetical protein